MTKTHNRAARRARTNRRPSTPARGRRAECRVEQRLIYVSHRPPAPDPSDDDCVDSAEAEWDWQQESTVIRMPAVRAYYGAPPPPTAGWAARLTADWSLLDWRLAGLSAGLTLGWSWWAAAVTVFVQFGGYA